MKKPKRKVLHWNEIGSWCLHGKRNKTREEKGYPTPICETKEATDINYDAAVHYMMEKLDKMAIFAGTHNE